MAERLANRDREIDPTQAYAIAAGQQQAAQQMAQQESEFSRQFEFMNRQLSEQGNQFREGLSSSTEQARLDRLEMGKDRQLERDRLAAMMDQVYANLGETRRTLGMELDARSSELDKTLTHQAKLAEQDRKASGLLSKAGLALGLMANQAARSRTSLELDQPEKNRLFEEGVTGKFDRYFSDSIDAMTRIVTSDGTPSDADFNKAYSDLVGPDASAFANALNDPNTSGLERGQMLVAAENTESFLRELSRSGNLSDVQQDRLKTAAKQYRAVLESPRARAIKKQIDAYTSSAEEMRAQMQQTSDFEQSVARYLETEDAGQLNLPSPVLSGGAFEDPVLAPGLAGPQLPPVSMGPSAGSAGIAPTTLEQASEQFTPQPGVLSDVASGIRRGITTASGQNPDSPQFLQSLVSSDDPDRAELLKALLLTDTQTQSDIQRAALDGALKRFPRGPQEDVMAEKERILLALKPALDRAFSDPAARKDPHGTLRKLLDGMAGGEFRPRRPAREGN